MLVEKVIPKVNGFSKRWEYELLAEVSVANILVPPFFSFDGASIPWPFWQILYTPYDPIVMLPSLVHDWLYTSHEVEQGAADQVLRDLLEKNEAPRWKRSAIYRAVTIFGCLPWENAEKHLAYLRWLRAKLEDNGVDPRRYCFREIGF